MIIKIVHRPITIRYYIPSTYRTNWLLVSYVIQPIPTFTMVRLLLLGAAAAVASCHAANTRMLTHAEQGHRRLQEYTSTTSDILQTNPIERHNIPPGHKPASQGGVVTKYSHLMSDTMCQPQGNGYFGSTAGSPAVLEYGFELEATIFGSVDRILDVIDQHIMTQILAETFSSICGVERRLVQHTEESSSSNNNNNRRLGVWNGDGSQLPSRNEVVTGFKFSEEMEDLSLLCVPTKHEQNSCGYYRSQIRVYGRDMGPYTVQTILNTIRASLPQTLELASKYGAVRIEGVEELLQQLSGPGINGKSDGPSVGAKIGLFVAILVLMMSLSLLYVFWKTDRETQRQSDPTVSSKKKKTKKSHGQQHSLYSTVKGSTTGSVSSLYSSEEQLSKKKHKLLLEFGPSFDMDRDRILQEYGEESSYAPSEFMFTDSAACIDYLDSAYRRDDTVENLQII